MKLFKNAVKNKELLLALGEDFDLVFVSENVKHIGLICNISEGELEVHSGLKDMLEEEGYDTSELKFDSEGRIKISKI